MEERKTVFDYLGQIFMIFGITVAILNVLCLLFGAEAQEISTIFSLGNQGLSIVVLAQFLGISVIIVLLRYLFFTDAVIKNMSITLRTICMVMLVLVTIVICIFLFGWFPVDMWIPWLMFLICFAVCFVISVILSTMQEKAQNRKMEEALQRIKQKE